MTIDEQIKARAVQDQLLEEREAALKNLNEIDERIVGAGKKPGAETKKKVAPTIKKPEELEEEIKARERIREIETKHREYTEKLDGVLGQIVQKGDELQSLLKAKETALDEIEKEAEDRVKGCERAIEDAAVKLERANLITKVVVEQFSDKLEGLVSSTVSVIEKARGLSERSKGMLANVENLISTFERAKSGLEDKIIKNSEIQRVLEKEKIKVELKSKEADRKLQKAEELAFWHKTPGATYKEEHDKII